MAKPDEVSHPYVELGLSPMFVSLDCVNFYEVPEGMSLSEFIDQLKAANAQAS